MHRALHGAAESDPAFKLVGNTVGNQLGIDIRLADFDDVQADVALGHRGDLLAQLLDVRTLLADDDTRAGGIDRHAAQLGRALDDDLGDRGLGRGS